MLGHYTPIKHDVDPFDGTPVMLVRCTWGSIAHLGYYDFWEHAGASLRWRMRQSTARPLVRPVLEVV